MLLAIDIGNTNIVFGAHDSNQWLNHWRIQTDALKTADEYEVIFRSLLSAGKICRTDIGKIIVSSVVPSLVRPFSEMFLNLFPSTKITVVNPEIYQQLPIKILNPYQMGTDLVANAVAAFQKFGTLTTIIDFGTALTFTTIGKNAEILGVAIAPGLHTAVNALAGKTAQLPEIHLTPPPSVLGENTVHAIQAGVVFGFSGLVDSIIEKTRNELNEQITVVATGGLSSVIAPLTKHIKIVEPMLTLDGLCFISNFVENS
ncbi:MAG: type III pantothenate kinase [Prolixibacteraceae bacterium]|jgi:type III pantothenate kinase|nr:type III pantothenate kinase [Prolixibacteraceae bacterium]MBT6005229.1 type III pantothenate kinase [Prolixibacteraceae bacterium]MBT6763166.1 type III pantothenate kinase [Prolixibacteraceae bacterium]MBT6998960.1 type III pantothenate kinase [Prolixibacteraceae bacterium]MBT7393909.1 type III pantothenate kinase [Prolixibacteraceae bacterium]